ncbi:MAG: hypothetical protein SVV03_06000 [Candidatus Nanohaloarchaea archaeon]|nr:hypothetical protein [Candidatus Nanohaloarchaea archaeon]
MVEATAKYRDEDLPQIEVVDDSFEPKNPEDRSDNIVPFDKASEDYEDSQDLESSGDYDLELYGQSAQEFDYDQLLEDIEPVLDYIEEEMDEDFEELYRQSFEEVVEDIESGDFDPDKNYLEFSEDGERAIKYDFEVSEKEGYIDVAPKFADLGDGLFGFTDFDDIVVNKNLYKHDALTPHRDKRNRIALHESIGGHWMSPEHPELIVRYKNGDPDVKNQPEVKAKAPDPGDGGLNYQHHRNNYRKVA